MNTGHTKVEGLSLELENVGRTDAGIYICTANNGVGKSASAQITVHINCKYIQKCILLNEIAAFSKMF